jgi:DNA end-binding protein Ku
MWKGAIQFGLVTIPIKLYLATESKGISFNMLHAKDLSRIQMKIVCPVEDEVISRGDTVRGFEWAKDEYVVVTDEDLESVPLKTVRAIEIEQFIRRDEGADGTIRFVKQAYYVEPDKIGHKAFTLLRSVLADKGLTAICKVVIKDREALAALDPFADTMVLTTLHWPDEIRAVADLDLPTDDFEFKPAERAMAEQLIEAMTGDFEPTQYRDEYREALMGVIEAKVEGRQVVQAAQEPAGALIDLMAALEASVHAARASRAQPVTVDEARARSAATSETGATRSRAAKAGTATSASAEQDDEGAADEARPARRRKSA